jgi:hypothetical protein
MTPYPLGPVRTLVMRALSVLSSSAVASATPSPHPASQQERKIGKAWFHWEGDSDIVGHLWPGHPGNYIKLPLPTPALSVRWGICLMSVPTLLLLGIGAQSLDGKELCFAYTRYPSPWSHIPEDHASQGHS